MPLPRLILCLVISCRHFYWESNYR